MKSRTIAATGGQVRVLRDYPALPTQYVQVESSEALLKLANDPNVAGISVPLVAHHDGDADLQLIRQPQVSDAGDEGAGTAVAVLDSGVDYTKFGCLSEGGRCPVALTQDIADDDNQLDSSGHGTNVAGVVTRVAPAAKIIALDIQQSDGRFYEPDIVAGLDAVIEYASIYHIRAINMSFGAGHYTGSCDDASVSTSSDLNYAWSLGILPVAASGNSATVDGSYRDGVAWPSCVSSAVSVGAVYDSDIGSFSWYNSDSPRTRCTNSTTESDIIACFSQGGSQLRVLAPGVNIDGGGSTWTGTSQAAPHVAGAASVLAAAAPSADTNAIAGAIISAGPAYIDDRSGTNYIVHRLDLVDASSQLQRAAVVDNDTIKLGVNQYGHFNVPNQAPSEAGSTVLGLRYLPTNNEATGPGCPCEGWGVADAATGASGYADEATGTSGLSLVEFSHTPTRVRSVVDIVGTSLQVTHDYQPSSNTPNLYDATVTIENLSADVAVGDVRYRRLVDWDVEPTAFDEYVTVQRGNSPHVVFTSDNGFNSANPLASDSGSSFTGSRTRSGPADHGALFDLGFGSLAPEASISFHLYYGAANNEAAALSVLSAIGAEAYSLGEPHTTSTPVGSPNTFILAFTGIGGTPLSPPPTIRRVRPIARGQGAARARLTVTGTGFAPGDAISISGDGLTVTPTTYVSATSLYAFVTVSPTAPTGPRDVMVTKTDGVVGSCNNCFTVNPGPSISSVSPASIARGGSAVLTVSGSNFQPGATVRVSGTEVTLGATTFVDDGTLQVPVTIGTAATTGRRTVTVVNPDGGRATCRCLRIT